MQKGGKKQHRWLYVFDEAPARGHGTKSFKNWEDAWLAYGQQPPWEREQAGKSTLRRRRARKTIGGLSSPAVSVSAGLNHSLALTAPDGAVWSWGGGGNGRFGHGDQQDQLLPTKIEAFAGRRVVAVSAPFDLPSVDFKPVLGPDELSALPPSPLTFSLDSLDDLFDDKAFAPLSSSSAKVLQAAVEAAAPAQAEAEAATAEAEAATAATAAAEEAPT